jgi:regulator of protease activity HflC (stomatin/prohibitin superfamily)
VLIGIIAVIVIVIVLAASGIRMVQQYERGVVLRFGAYCPPSGSRGCN